MSDFTVVSSGVSMFPLIRDGMRVLIRPTPPDRIEPGDIIAFRRGDVIVLHRLIRKRGNLFLEKGDNTRVGFWISAETCLGRAVRAENESVVLRLDTPAGDPRIRWLTRLSRWESVFFGFFRRAADTVWRPGAERPRGFFARAASFAALPLRAAALPLLRAYPRETRREDLPQLREVVRLFRRLNGRGDEVNWDGLLPLAVAHGLEALSAGFRDECRPMRHRAAFMHMNAMLTMSDIVRALRTAGIPHAILKGPPLALGLYGDGGRRAYVDLDVLVPLAQRDDAIRAFSGAGYRARGTPWQQAAVKRGHFHLVFDPPSKTRVAVELHWGLVDRANLYRLDEADIQSRWRVEPVGDVEAGRLGIEDELLYLLLHIAKHGLFNGYGVRRGAPAEWFCRGVTGNRLIWFMDIQRFLEKHEDRLDWAAMRERSHRWNISDEIFQSLEILNRLLPDDRAARAIERLGFERAMFVESESGDAPIPAWVMKWMEAEKNVVVRPARLLTIGRLFVPPPRVLRGFYGGSGAPLPWLYLWHPIRMFVRLARG